jgi:hypothetical protein
MISVIYRHRFNYREFQSGHYPILQLRLTYPGNNDAIDVDAYLDSGAERSLFDGSLLGAFGIPLINEKPKTYASTAGATVVGYLHNVRLTLPDVATFNLEVGFSNGNIRRNLLGRDFFNLVQIGFRERHLEYYLTAVP